jgi:hypothetical protein
MTMVLDPPTSAEVETAQQDAALMVARYHGRLWASTKYTDPLDLVAGIHAGYRAADSTVGAAFVAGMRDQLVARLTVQYGPGRAGVFVEVLDGLLDDGADDPDTDPPCVETVAAAVAGVQ